MRAPTAVAALLVAVTGVLLVFALVLNTGQAAPEGPSDAAAIALMLALLAFPATGYVLASRRPRNPIGWLFLLFGLGFFGALGLEEYAVRTLVTDPGSLPFGIWAAWVSSWMWIFWMAPVALAILLFPDGRLATPRARPLLWLVVLWAGLQFIMAGLAQRALPSERLAAFSNPLAVDALAPLASLEEVTVVGWLFILLAPIPTMVFRLRRAHGRERLQLRWFAYATGLVLAVALLLVAAESVMTFLGVEPAGLDDILWFAFIASFAGLPLATAIAILRYRLYDIDLLINRTLVYGAVTALLAATYFGSVVLIQASLRPFTAGSEFAVAASTLLVAALFQPLRRRVQDAVDRRFYRSRYDAARTLDAFGLRLRDEVDLDSVRADLLDVVRETVRPAHASVWLRERR